MIEKIGFVLKTRFHRLLWSWYNTCSSLKLSSHNLAIEKGRHLSIPKHERLCNFCNTGAIEDEFHFLFSCSKYIHLRTVFERNLYTCFHTRNNFSKMSDIFKAKFCFNSKSSTVLKIALSFINKCTSYRNSAQA